MKLTNQIQLVRSPEKRYRLAIAERRHLPVRAPTQEQVRFYYRRLGTLAELMSDAPFCWHLEGGHVLPLRIGQFLRQHGDIDLGFYQHDLRRIIDFFKDRGYDFFYRNYHFSPLENLPWDLFERTDLNQMLQKPLKRLYAMKVRRDGRIDEGETVLRELDLHVHTREGQIVYTSKQRIPLPSVWFKDTFSYKQNGSPAIELGGLKVFYYFKLSGGRPRHKFDVEAIEKRGLLTPSEIREVRSVHNSK